MKALHTSIFIVAAAVVILIAALVTLGIFGIGVTTFTSMAEAASQCSMQAASVCQAAGSLPLTWGSDSVLVNNIPVSCREATSCNSCSCILGEGLVGDFEPREEFYSGDFGGRGVGIELPEESLEIAMNRVPQEVLYD